MMRDSEMFATHAARCRQDAADAVLDNVRRRAERSAGAWTAMAERSLLTEKARDRRDAAKAEEAEPVALVDGA